MQTKCYGLIGEKSLSAEQKLLKVFELLNLVFGLLEFRQRDHWQEHCFLNVEGKHGEQHYSH